MADKSRRVDTNLKRNLARRSDSAFASESRKRAKHGDSQDEGPSGSQSRACDEVQVLLVEDLVTPEPARKIAATPTPPAPPTVRVTDPQPAQTSLQAEALDFGQFRPPFPSFGPSFPGDSVWSVTRKFVVPLANVVRMCAYGVFERNNGEVGFNGQMRHSNGKRTSQIYESI